VSCSNPRQTRFVFNLVLLAALAAVRPVLDNNRARPRMKRPLVCSPGCSLPPMPAASISSPWRGAEPCQSAVRRQGALAAGRIGDPAAVDLLLPVLNDSVPGAQAAAAFALGLLKDARAIPLLLEKVRAVSSMEQGAPQLEAVTAIAKIAETKARGRSLIFSRRFARGGRRDAGVNAALLESWRLGPRAPVAELVRLTDAFDGATRWRALYSLAALACGSRRRTG